MKPAPSKENWLIGSATPGRAPAAWVTRARGHSVVEIRSIGLGRGFLISPHFRRNVTVTGQMTSNAGEKCGSRGCLADELDAFHEVAGGIAWEEAVDLGNEPLDAVSRSVWYDCRHDTDAEIQM